jgi:hypothetical protein
MPATGKTTGARFLDPKKTYYIDADGKGLSWKGWKSDYNSENKNYAKTTDIPTIYKLIKTISESKPDINCIVIDTINAIMTTEEMEILENPSRDQWKDLATSVWNLYKMMREIKRDDLVVFVMAHCEPYDVNGITHYRTMTNGKKLSKINLNAFLAYNLYTKVTKTPDNKFTYDLITQSDGTTEARSVMGVFDPKIENNLEVVRKSVLEAEIG